MNPRCRFRHSSFRDCHLQPLGHLSKKAENLIAVILRSRRRRRISFSGQILRFAQDDRQKIMAEREGLSRPIPGARPSGPSRLRLEVQFLLSCKNCRTLVLLLPTLSKIMAEREGFEPSVHFCTYDFQSYPFCHSGTSPLKKPKQIPPLGTFLLTISSQYPLWPGHLSVEKAEKKANTKLNPEPSGLFYLRFQPAPLMARAPRS